MGEGPAPETHAGLLARAEWLRAAPLTRLLAVLDGEGEEARAIGGAVRNALLGEAVHEIDIATTAIPEAVIRRVTEAGFKAVPTGIDHGTVTVVVDGQPFEVTTLRVDVVTFGRKATVRFGRDWRADAERRDFTMNALSVTADGTVHDYVGGLGDLQARRIRFIGDPSIRIAEDYLRILRFFRFHAAYGEGEPDAAGLAACIAGRSGLALLSRERVRMELLKLLVARRAVQTIVAMADTGLLGMPLDGVPQVAAFAAMVERETTLSLPPDAMRRLAALAVFVTEDAERLWERLRLTNAEHARLAAMGEAWWRVSPAASEQAARILLYRLRPEAFRDRVLMAWAHAQASSNDTDWIALATLPQRWRAPAFPLKAADFMRLGLTPGPALGEAMRTAEKAWIAADFPTDADAVARLAQAAVPSRPPA
jgi:tRNA nucleotidyltransferase/poly(A) polymerase